MAYLNPTTQQGWLWLGFALVTALVTGTVGYYAPGEGHDPIVGSIGLALSIAMLITSVPGPTRSLGRRLWKWVHKAGFYVFMFNYFLSGMLVRTLVLFQRPSTAQAAK